MVLIIIESNSQLFLFFLSEDKMIPQVAESIKEFIAIHHDELQQFPVAKTPLFSDYVSYCHENGYDRHSNLVQFCREITVEGSIVHH